MDCSVFADCGVSPHRALCWLVREAVDRREGATGPAKGRYKRAYREAENRLRARSTVFEPLDGDRLDMLIAKPNAALRPGEVQTLSLIAGLLLEGLSAAESAALRARAIERARTQPGAQTPARSGPGTEASVDPWAQIYRGAWREQQDLLGELGGAYLIFRRFHRAGGGHPILIVSHMTIEAAPGGDGPARFRTVGAGSGKDERVVEGLIYEANASHGALFSVGRELETAQIRNTMLLPVDKPVPHGALETGARRDLKGVRLAISRFSGDPRAYRLWCASIDGPAPDGGDWRALVKDYMEGESLAAFETGVPGFDYIHRWLSRPVQCVLDDDDDPPTP